MERTRARSLLVAKESLVRSRLIITILKKMPILIFETIVVFKNDVEPNLSNGSFDSRKYHMMSYHICQMF